MYREKFKENNRYYFARQTSIIPYKEFSLIVNSREIVRIIPIVRFLLFNTLCATERSDTFLIIYSNKQHTCHNLLHY